MAIVLINYVCGCGFRRNTIEEAIKHVDETRHTLNVAGTIKSTEQKVRKASPTVYSNTRKQKGLAVAEQTEMELQDSIDFSNLRARLQNRQ